MNRKKSVGIRVVLCIVAVACGIAVQVFGSLFGMITGLPGIELIIGLAGFGVMGYLIYKWVIK